MRNGYWNGFLRLIAVAGTCVQITILIAVFQKHGGTTGAEPYTLLIPFGFILLLGLYAYFRKPDFANRSLTKLAIVVGIFGCILPYWLERTGSLVQYERWLRNNQGPNAENLGLSLLLFAGAESLVAITALLWKRRRVSTNDEI